MICAYDESLLTIAQRNMGGMIDYAVYALNYELKDFYRVFLASKKSVSFAHGDSKTVSGTSGIELTHIVTGTPYLAKEDMDKYEIHAIKGRSPEYWTGWVLAYFQWMTSLSFAQIDSVVPIEVLVKKYNPYHEADISKVAGWMLNKYKETNQDSALKRMRKLANLTQKELAETTGIPIKTIQQYEQKQKDINRASVDYIISLSRALNCDMELLIEKV